MSAIRPPVPSPLFPTQTPPAPARASRSAFFQAALDGLKAATAAEPAPVEEAARPLAAPAAGIADRPTRPGALLDIRV
jgi:hypothetical protein